MTTDKNHDPALTNRIWQALYDWEQAALAEGDSDLSNVLHEARHAINRIRAVRDGRRRVWKRNRHGARVHEAMRAAGEVLDPALTNRIWQALYDLRLANPDRYDDEDTVGFALAELIQALCADEPDRVTRTGLAEPTPTRLSHLAEGMKGRVTVMAELLPAAGEAPAHRMVRVVGALDAGAWGNHVRRALGTSRKNEDYRFAVMADAVEDIGDGEEIAIRVSSLDDQFAEVV